LRSGNRPVADWSRWHCSVATRFSKSASPYAPFDAGTLTQ
jgi:hypothetical protein